MYRGFNINYLRESFGIGYETRSPSSRANKKEVERIVFKANHQRG